MKDKLILNKTFLTLLMLGLSTSMFAADGVSDLHAVEKLLGNVVLVSAAVVIVSAFIALGYMSNMLMQTQRMRLLEEQGVEALEKAGVTVNKESWFSWLYKKATDVVPVEKEKDILFDHEYDGIRELDNSLPPWWVAMFYITIFIGVVYFTYYHITGSGMSSREAYELEMEEAEEAIQAYLAKQADTVDETNVEMLADENEIALGESLYKANCAACHGQLGEGGVGPNLTDDYWIHGGSIKDVFKTIKYGVPEKGMISWKSQLRPTDMHKVSSFIMTLKGTNPPNAKEPQGEIYNEEPAEEGADQTEDEQIGMRQ
jgi:cytochrome c oxidase cbb3-type subunit 3